MNFPLRLILIHNVVVHNEVETVYRPGGVVPEKLGGDVRPAYPVYDQKSANIPGLCMT